MIILCGFVLWTYLNTVNGYSKDVITPYNTNNKDQAPIYCGFGDRTDCINIIPQNIPISKENIIHE